MRIIQTQDYQTVVKLNKTVHDLHVRLYPSLFKPFDEVMTSNYMKEMMKNPSFIFLLAEDVAGNPVGYAWVELINYPENQFTYSYSALFIRQISVETSKKHKGYGSALMNAINKIVVDFGVERIELDYWAANIEVDQFYQKHGFTKNRIFISKRL